MKKERECLYRALASAVVFAGGILLSWGGLVVVDRLFSLLGV